MSCNDIPSLLDLQKAKLNADDFGRLMGTGEGDSTNEVTGQVRPTYNKVINDMNSEFDGMITGMNSEFDGMIVDMNSEFDSMIVDMNSEFDAQILNMGFTRVGTFATGATLTNPRQTLLWDLADGGDGQEYGWSGVFPPSGKVVPPGSTPLTTGGISVGAWISRFDPELRIQIRESLRRSYAEAGYNLVDGSFEAGGTLVNANDVLLQERTGKAFSGPAGTVASGTNPASGGFVDKSGGLLRHEVEGGDLTVIADGATMPRRLGERFADAVNVKDFGAVGDGVTDDTLAIQAGADYAKSINGTLYVPDGTYIVSDEIRLEVPLRGESKFKTILKPVGFSSTKVTKYKRWSTSNSLTFSGYEGTTKAVLNTDGVGSLHLEKFSIDTGVFVKDDSAIDSLPSITGIRAGRADNLVEGTSTCSRSSYKDIKISGVHTALDTTGYIMNYNNVSIFNAKNGVVASEWNNVTGSIIMEIVQRALQVYTGSQVNLESFINESFITCEPNILVGCSSFYINGFYLEGNKYPNGVFRLGMAEDLGNLPQSFGLNKDIRINGSSVNIPNQEEPMILSDLTIGLKVSGAWSQGYNRNFISRTRRTRDVSLDINILYRDYADMDGSNLFGEIPINYFPSPMFNNKSAGTFSYGRSFSGGDGSTYKTEWLNAEDNGVNPVGANMLKLTTLNGSSQNIFLEIRRVNEWGKYVKEGDLITIGLLAYIPSQTYRDGNIDGNGTNMPFLSGQALGDTNTGGGVVYMPNYDKWCMYFCQFEAPANMRSLSVQAVTSNGFTMPSGTHIYLGGALVCIGNDAKQYMSKLMYRNPPAEFGDESSGNMYVKTQGSSNALPDSMEFTVGDKITNPTTSGSGHMQNIQCLVEGSRYTPSKRGEWSPVDLPPVYDIPTTNSGVWSTCWLDNGVLKINNSQS